MLLTAYNHLPGYLHRWRVVAMGRFMLRVHRILDIDRTPFLHSHPFAYLSIVLRGGYDERVLQADGTLRLVRRGVGSVVFRRAAQLHRIDAVRGACSTLFFTWRLAGGGQNWTLQRHRDVATPLGYDDAPDGLYPCADGYRRREGGVWFAKRPSAEEALACMRLSVHQRTNQH